MKWFWQQRYGIMAYELLQNWQRNRIKLYYVNEISCTDTHTKEILLQRRMRNRYKSENMALNLTGFFLGCRKNWILFCLFLWDKNVEIWRFVEIADKLMKLFACYLHETLFNAHCTRKRELAPNSVNSASIASFARFHFAYTLLFRFFATFPLHTNVFNSGSVKWFMQVVGAMK